MPNSDSAVWVRFSGSLTKTELLRLVAVQVPPEEWGVSEIWDGGPKGTCCDVTPRRDASGEKIKLSLESALLDGKHLLIIRPVDANWSSWLREMRSGAFFAHHVTSLRCAVLKALQGIPGVVEYGVMSDSDYDKEVSGVSRS